MPTAIIEGKLYISVREVMSFLTDFQNAMEKNRENGLNDIAKMDLLPPVRKMAVTLTNLDFDLFSDTLERNILSYKKQLEEEIVKKSEVVIHDEEISLNQSLDFSHGKN